MRKLIERWNSLLPWQRSGGLCVAGSAGVWLLLGAAAALGFGLGVLGGFNLGGDYAKADK